MFSCFRQYNALMYKNWLLKKRHWKSTCFEIWLPVFIMLIMVGIRAAIKRDDFGVLYYPCDGCVEPTDLTNTQRLQYDLTDTTPIGANGRTPTESHSKLFVPYKIPFDMEKYGVGVVMPPGKAREDFIASIRRHAIYINASNPDSSFFRPLRVYTWDNHDAYQSYMTSSSYGVLGNSKIYGAWYITRGDASDPHWEYTIRLPVGGPNQEAATIETDGSEINTIQARYDRSWLLLYQSGFTWFQHIAENHFLNVSSGLTMVRTFSAAPFPTPPYIKDDFTTMVSDFLGFYFTIVYLWPVTRVVKLFVDEKESRIKEGMRMMGLRDTPWFLSHLMTSFTIALLTSILITLVTSTSVFKYSSKIYIWFFFFMFGMSVFSFGFLMSVFFSKSKIATTFSAILFFAFFFPYFAVNSSSTATSQKMVAGLSPTIAFALGSVCIADFEATGKGIQSDNVNIQTQNISYNQAIGMLLIDFFGYLILGLYFDRVIKTEWGTQLPWYFPVTLQFWCPRQPIPDVKRAPPGQPHQVLHDQTPNDMIEPVSDAVRANVGVSIQSLRKEFVVPNTGSDVEPQVAVRDISLDLYTNQILALLGHNGAGKTTTINMLCGLMPPTSGDADVFGAKISYDMPIIRQSLGVCPQHNILFNDLTVEEHLELYCAIKGVPRDQTKAAVKDMISQVGLEEKIRDKSGALSGGMKRKLSVGIALIGDSKIVFLDEPTSGMDPYSRRATWDLLKKKKEGRVIILTTHFMDEADQLGDRIAIMASGSIKCCGSSLFLKSRYGVGYTMTITKGEHCDSKKVDELVHHYVSEAEFLSNVAGEMSYRLPLAASSQFADMFDALDASTRDLGIDAYGISVTTLEEVFLRVGHEDTEEAKNHTNGMNGHAQKSDSVKCPMFHDKDVNHNTLTPIASSVTMMEDEKTSNSSKHHHSVTIQSKNSHGENGQQDGHGSPLPHVDTDFDRSRFTRTLRALLIKRWHNAKRDRKGWSWTILYPFLILLLGVAILTSTGEQNQSARVLSPSIYNTPNRVPFQSPDARSAAVLSTTNVSAPIASPQEINSVSFSYDPYQTNDNYIMSRYLIQNLCSGYIDAMQSKLNSSITNTQNYGPSYCPYYRYTDTTFFATSYVTLGQSGQSKNTGSTILDVSKLSNIPKTLLEYQMNVQQLNTSAPSYNQPINLSGLNYSFTNPSPHTYFDAFTLLFNTSVKHGVISAYNLVNTGLLRALTGDNTASITLTTWPQPRTFDQKALAQSTLSLIVAIAFAFIPASFIGYAVKEESDKAKHQQMISGVSATCYWTSNYIWDFCNYLIPGLLCLAVFGMFSVDELIGENAGATFLSILLYGISIIPFTYILSFAFRDHNTAQNVTLLLYIFVGALLLIASIVLDIIDSTKDANSHLKFIYRLFPSYCFGECIVNLIVRGSETAFDTPRGIWDMDVVGWPMIFMTWESIVYVIILYLIEFILAHPGLLSMFQRNVPVQPTPYQDDIDVQRERERIQAMSQPPKDDVLLDHTRDMITLAGLRKVYPSAGKGVPKVAVHDLWLGIPEGECFGYLGINGAGKTTTLKMLTADIIPTAGTGYLGGYNMLTEQAQVRKLIGYCPQFDALIDTLTAREHLYLFARIKGVPESSIPDYVDKLIHRLGLQEGQADKPARGYSGGNKRKLCVGIALIGSPKIVFLDEPSTGMDPGSRRFMWDLIASTMKGRSVILTTHSMEEVTALCSRIGIMVGGRLRCLGSTQHLKSRYGDGYQMEAHLSSIDAVEPFQQWLFTTFPGTRLIEVHSDHVKYEIPKTIDGNVQSIGMMFRAVENEKNNLNILEYSLSETTLEQIFINFAKQQEEEKGPIAGFV